MLTHSTVPGSYDRVVCYVSDGTGITAETFGHSLLIQFENVVFKQIRMPFIKSMSKADEVVEKINLIGQTEGKLPIVFSTLVNPEINARVRQANAMFLDLFTSFVKPLERELAVASSHSIGRSHDNVNTKEYQHRIEAINFALTHDDGQSLKNLEQADVILIGVSRSGKTPTSLYLAMQYGVRAANYPLIPEDFERQKLPPAILKYRNKLFGLSITPERLAEVRHERRPNSVYATLTQCRYEVAEAEKLMRMESIRWMSSTTKSIEEIAATVLEEVGIERRVY